MKLLLILGLGMMISYSSFADFVYMKEDTHAKSVQLQTDNPVPTTLNDSSNKLWALYPDISVDGNEFIYTAGADQKDMHLVYVNKSKNLTQRFNLSRKGMLLHPKFSKNKKFIFYSAPGTSGRNTIYFFDRDAEVTRQGENLMDFSLENAQALVPDDEAYFPRPSSDGNFVVYQRNSAGKKEIILFDRIAQTKKVLAEGMSPALSFDETTIAFTSKKDGNWNIYTVDRISGKIVQMTFDEKDEMAPTFKVDNILVFAANKTGHFRLYQLIDEKWESLINIADSAEVDFYSPQFSGDTIYKQTTRAAFPGNPRSSFGTIAHEGKIYMCGGHQGKEHTYPPESFSDQFFVYDIATNAWKELAPRPFKAHGYQLAAHKNYIYAFGGFVYSADYSPKWTSLDVIDRYDITTNKWETVGKLHSRRSSNQAVNIDNKVYIVGGWDSTPKYKNDINGTFLDTIEIFDLETEKVQLAPYKIPNPVRRAFTGMAHNTEIILLGGIGAGGNHFELINKVTAINPITGDYRELTPLPFATFAPAAQFLGDELMVFGGMYKIAEMDYEYVSHIYALKEGKWGHTGRYLKETKGFSQIFKLDEKTLGILGGHHYFEGYDSPVTTFETITK